MAHEKVGRVAKLHKSFAWRFGKNGVATTVPYLRFFLTR